MYSSLGNICAHWNGVNGFGNEKTGSAEDSIENEDAYTESEDTGSDLTEYDGSEKTQDETEENMSEESIEDNTVEE